MSAQPAQSGGQAHESFECIGVHAIETLDISFEHYRHRVTGAEHFHFAADSDENVFLVALRTLPSDSTGVAHILEHTALCGSERYPVRDPFFMMIRRSLNTFMNAFTSSDWTAYPFASQNRKDFSNLLDVYLDAVFFSRLHELDFAQEGHRLEFATPDNPESDLVFKGVVFNEMKGAMSSITSTLWHTLCEHLYTDTTYHHNSGGEPVNIPDLSYTQLKDFYRSHYHPSNAIFMTFGDIPAAEHQAVFEERALARFPERGKVFSVGLETRFSEPKRVSRPYALDESNADLKRKTHVVVSWLLGESANLKDLFRGHLLASALMDNSASPLQHALETSDLGSAPSPLCGLEDSNRELVFACGLEGTAEDATEAVETLVLDVLRDVAANGIDQAQVEAVLHQLELHQREIGGDGYPYGLQLMMQTLTAATHGGDPAAMLDIEPVLAELRESIKDPGFIRSLAQELLDNPHRLTLTMTPDTELSAQKEADEAARLADIKAGLSDKEKQAIVEQAAALQERQAQEDDDSVLPKVGLEDIPADIKIHRSEKRSLAGMPADVYTAGTNGLCYQQVLLPIPSLEPGELSLLPLYTQCLTELGVGERDYMQTQAWQSAVCGSIHAYSTMRGAIDDEQAMSAYILLSSKALARNHAAMDELLRETLLKVRFDEHSRIRELVSQSRARREASVTGNGHSLAMLAASSGMSPYSNLSHQLTGLAGIRATKELDERFGSDAYAIAAVAQQLTAMHQKIIAQPRRLVLIGEEERLPDMLASIDSAWQGAGASEQQTSLYLDPVRETRRQAWIANTQVNFCAKSYPTVPVDHEDAAALTVLGGFLRNGFLHRAIREQGGAYGGGASQDSTIAAFRFYSYRDPRIDGTLADFDDSLRWLQDNDHSEQALEEAILGVIGSLDKPGSPAGEMKQAFQNELFGRDPDQRRRFRQRIVAVTIADLKRVAATYLNPELASVGVITNAAHSEELPADLEQFTL